jgi:Mor family transcriptional regulator
MADETRVCKKCGRERPLTDFQLRNKLGTLRSHTCIDCTNEHRKDRYNNGVAPRYNEASPIYCLIYVIRNSANEKVYVGQTWRDLSVRWAAHCLPSTSTHCVKLRRAIKKYGEEKFRIELLTICHTQEVTDYWEKYFIHKFDSIKHGYNILEGGGLSRKGTKHSPKTRKVMSLARKGEGNSNSVLEPWQVIQIREEYNNYTNPNTGSKYGAITFLAKRYNMSISAIFEVVKGKAWQ